MSSKSPRAATSAVATLALIGGILVAGSATTSPASATSATRTTLTYASGTAAWYNAAESTVMSPQLIDWDGDGNRDAIDRGLLFLNAGDDETPVFSPVGSPLALPGSEGTLLDWDADGDHDFLSRYDLHLHRNTGTDASPVWVDAGELVAGGQPITAAYVAAGYVRWNQLQTPNVSYDDWDGDGDDDLIVSVADRGLVGSSPEIYKHGRIFVYVNTGTASAPVLAAGTSLQTATGDLDVPFKALVATADWNGDGQLDVLFGDYRGDVHVAERSGTDVLPAVRILDTGDINAWLDVADRDGDGDLDLIVTSTRGMLLVENTGTASSAALSERGLVQMPAAGVDIRSGLFQHPFAVDWEDDGDLDLVVGDENGRISLFENVGTGAVPELVEAVDVQADGEPINLDSLDAEGSWEWGQSEAAAGYTNPVVVDWDGDGDLDILTQDAQEASLWYFENTGTRSAPVYGAEVAFTRGGAPFASPWRSRVAAMDWDGDGELELVQAGADNILTVYGRGSGDLDLTVLAVAEDAAGVPVSVASSRAGRTNLQAVDWDGDGLTDLLQGAYDNTALSWFRNVGVPGAPVFERQYVRNADDTLYETLSNHTPKTFAVDWNDDGALDLIDSVVWGSMSFVDGTGLSHEPVVAHPSRLEAESLDVAGSSGDPISTFADATSSAGASLRYEATAVGDHIALKAGDVPPGDYRVALGMRVAPNRATVQVSIGGVAVGGPVDAHAASAGASRFDLGVVTITSGSPEIRLTVTGRNAASSSYAIYADYVELIPRLEAEDLVVRSSSGDALSLYSNTGASGGATINFAADAIGDQVTLSSPPVVSGRYRVLVGMRVAPNRAIVQTSINGVAVGSPIDGHSATAGYQVFDLGTTHVGGIGSRDIRFSVTGKNAASGTYAVYVDYVELLPVGQRFEAETLTRTSTSGDPLGMFEDPVASEGGTAYFAATAVGDQTTYAVDVRHDDDYDVTLGFRVAANRGTVQLSIDGVPVGSPIDTRRTTAGYLSFAVGSLALTEGVHEVRLELVGTSSTSYAVYLDYIDLVPA